MSDEDVISTQFSDPPQPDAVADALRALRKEWVDARREERNKFKQTSERVELLEVLLADEVLPRVMLRDQVDILVRETRELRVQLDDVRRALHLETRLGDHDLTPAQRGLLRQAYAGDRPEDVDAWLTSRVAAFDIERTGAQNTLAERAKKVREALGKP